MTHPAGRSNRPPERFPSRFTHHIRLRPSFAGGAAAMTISANALEREDAVVADDGGWRLGLVFEPETFFLGRTEGAGVMRDPFGRIVRRYHITTTGAFSAGQRALR